MPPAIKQITFDTAEALNTAFHNLLRESLQQRSPTPYAVMLSGGRTPLPVFQQVAREPFNISENANITYTDERHVPDDSRESNYGASKPMLDALRISDARILRPDTGLTLEEAADNWHGQLSNFLESGGAIPLAILGLGADGHTCSLFTQKDLDRASDKYAAPVYKDTPPNRITATPLLLSRVGRIVFLVSGADKTATIDQLLSTPSDVVAGRAVADCKAVELWRSK